MINTKRELEAVRAINAMMLKKVHNLTQDNDKLKVIAKRDRL